MQSSFENWALNSIPKVNLERSCKAYSSYVSERTEHLYRAYCARPDAAGVYNQAVEDCAKEWDGCVYEAVAEDIDIGKAIRALKNPTATAPDDTKERCDGRRVIEWLDNPNRQRANLAFTDGLERQIAYRFEAIRAAAIRREVVEECAKLCDAYANKQQGRMEAEGTCYSLHMQRRDTAFRLAQQLRALINPTATAGKEKQNG